MGGTDLMALGFGSGRQREARVRGERKARERKEVTSPLPYTSKYTRLQRGM